MMLRKRRHRKSQQSCECKVNELHRFLLMTVRVGKPQVAGFLRWSSATLWLPTGILAQAGAVWHVNFPRQEFAAGPIWRLWGNECRATADSEFL
jgi:hypothetical protein